MNASLRFDIIAEAFRLQTKYMAPGKSVPDCMYQDPQKALEAWTKWFDENKEACAIWLKAFENVTGFDEDDE